MSITPKQIDIWRQSASEHQRLEFKEAKTQFDFTTLSKYCIAIANEGGGHLLLGIADKPPRPVVGTQAFQDVVEAARKLFDKIKVTVQPSRSCVSP
ncbi:MAG: ATP-binding protein [Magnetococcales bacterium]|nr:ATP-binding protein [Magnetococcales bacterium]